MYHGYTIFCIREGTVRSLTVLDKNIKITSKYHTINTRAPKAARNQAIAMGFGHSVTQKYVYRKY